MNSQKLTHLLITKVFLISTSKLDSERLSACSCPDSSGSPVCDQCLPHYSGPQCDECSAGFFRSSVGCVRCDCSGNADPQGPIQLCHPKTGHCFHCINNTTGPQCQLCAPGFVGNATAHNCTRPSKLLCVRWFVCLFFGLFFCDRFSSLGFPRWNDLHLVGEGKVWKKKKKWPLWWTWHDPQKKFKSPPSVAIANQIWNMRS